MKKKLKRTEQCDSCPWRKNADPIKEIPNYKHDWHKSLQETIAIPGSFKQGLLKVMSCHCHDSEERVFCVGWLHNQLGPGNNLDLRLRVLDYEPFKINLKGPQHPTFEDTIP